MLSQIQRFGGAMFTPVLLFPFAGIVVGIAIMMRNPMFGTSDVLFEEDDCGMTDEERRYGKGSRMRLIVQNSRPCMAACITTLSQHEQTLARHYDDRVSFIPDGKGGFVVQVSLAETGQ